MQKYLCSENARLEKRTKVCVCVWGGYICMAWGWTTWSYVPSHPCRTNAEMACSAGLVYVNCPLCSSVFSSVSFLFFFLVVTGCVNSNRLLTNKVQEQGGKRKQTFHQPPKISPRRNKCCPPYSAVSPDKAPFRGKQGPMHPQLPNQPSFNCLAKFNPPPPISSSKTE